VDENSNMVIRQFWLDKWCYHPLASLMNIPNMFWRHLLAKVIVHQVIVPIGDRTDKVIWIYINSGELFYRMRIDGGFRRKREGII